MTMLLERDDEFTYCTERWLFYASKGHPIYTYKNLLQMLLTGNIIHGMSVYKIKTMMNKWESDNPTLEAAYQSPLRGPGGMDLYAKRT